MEAPVKSADSHEPVAAPAADGVVQMRQVKATRVNMDRVPDVLGTDEAAWLGTRLPAESSGVRSFLCDLEVTSGAGERTVLRKSAIVGFGAPSRAGDEWVVPVEWRASTLAPLFPVFAGRLRIEPESIELTGSYAPPFGKLGIVLDAALLGRAARATARWFLARVSDALA